MTGNSDWTMETIGNDEWMLGIEEIAEEDTELLERLAKDGDES